MNNEEETKDKKITFAIRRFAVLGMGMWGRGGTRR
jgi:hypothetical protein